MVNNTMTIAASGHWPSTMAPVTAMLINALMFRLPLRRATHPFLYVVKPQATTARIASAAENPSGRPIQLTTSDAIAALPARANGHHGFIGSSATAAS